MYSQLFCDTLDAPFSILNPENNGMNLIKIYTIELVKYQSLAIKNTTILSESEKFRAERFHFEKDKSRFIICRILLKFLLAEHIGMDIQSIQIDVDANKKPYLGSHPSVFFNVSHSGEYAIIAISNKPIGVDVEFIKKSFQFEDILPITFHPIEIDAISASSNKQHAFYKYWTRKEAIVKAIGKGIDDDLPKITVIDGLHTIPLDLMDNFRKINVFSFPINHEYIGALASCDEYLDIQNIVFPTLPSLDKIMASIS